MRRVAVGARKILFLLRVVRVSKYIRTPFSWRASPSSYTFVNDSEKREKVFERSARNSHELHRALAWFIYSRQDYSRCPPARSRFPFSLVDAPTCARTAARETSHTRNETRPAIVCRENRFVSGYSPFGYARIRVGEPARSFLTYSNAAVLLLYLYRLLSSLCFLPAFFLVVSSSQGNSPADGITI